MMNAVRKAGLVMLVVAAAAALSHWWGLELPSLRWFFSFGATPDQVLAARGSEWNGLDLGWLRENQGNLAGYGMCAVVALAGMAMLLLGGRFHWNPLTLRKMARFRSIGRGHASFRLLLVLGVLALLDQALVGKRALAVKYEGRWSFPAFEQRRHLDRDFGGEAAEEVDYRALAARLAALDPASRVILPPVPWDPTFDSDERMRIELDVEDGVIRDPSGGRPYRGFATLFRAGDPEAPGATEQRVRSGSIRDGRLQGPVQVFGADGGPVGREEWRGGELVSSTVPAGAVPPVEGTWIRQVYPPLPPSWDKRHFLGTDSKGWDILAQLFGGMQVLFKASFLYLVISYGVGVTIGSLMGYFGGVFDLVMQRLLEIVSNVPFLLVVMIIIANIGQDKVTLATIMLIYCLFSWISSATYLRTATYKEKARDYVSAARVLGAGTGRIVFRHILPNTIATIVTLVPFGVASVVTALTALDFLGFGLPESYPSWGRLLGDGVSNLGSPWIVSSVFAMMVFVLLLVTFVGEAIREAFDPRTYTTYQ